MRQHYAISIPRISHPMSLVSTYVPSSNHVHGLTPTQQDFVNLGAVLLAYVLLAGMLVYNKLIQWRVI